MKTFNEHQNNTPLNECLAHQDGTIEKMLAASKEEQQKENGTDLTTVYMAEADDLPQNPEVPEDVATMQQRITESSRPEASKPEEVGIPLSEHEPPQVELREQTILLKKIEKHLSFIAWGVTFLAGLVWGSMFVACLLYLIDR